MERGVAVALFTRLHDAQGAFYAGGPAGSLRDLLSDDVVWRVPGDNAIAGTYVGVDAPSSTRSGACRTSRAAP